ncbi:MAG: hypothetical protein MJY70_00815 [Bacteroidales bacterium]|nr:hypothetical protein [Bacteroidales bacterium]
MYGSAAGGLFCPVLPGGGICSAPAFTPGQKGGSAVPVQFDLLITFPFDGK